MKLHDNKSRAAMLPFVIDVVQGVSSKHSEAAITLYHRFQDIVQIFKHQVITIFFVQEFSPSTFRIFFQSLKFENKENRTPILPVLAIGHDIKNAYTGLLKSHAVPFDVLFRANGISIGSAEYGRYRNRRNIRQCIDFFKYLNCPIENRAQAGDENCDCWIINNIAECNYYGRFNLKYTYPERYGVDDNDLVSKTEWNIINQRTIDDKNSTQHMHHFHPSFDDFSTF